ncbi:MAG: hypothetical protein ACRENY_04935 [Candidatus Dormibacteria bacterium]
MIEDFESFLRGTHTSESIPPGPLRAAISVDTGLEEPIAEALAAGRDVVVTGSAGGGKTQFIERVVELLRESGAVGGSTSPDENAPQDHIVVVRDLTAIRHEQRGSSLEGRAGTTARLVGANEGTLGSVDRHPFDRVLETLHNMQQGMIPSDVQSPVIVDLGGFDPFDKAFTEILGLPLLAEVVDHVQCCVTERSCPRRRAWRQLASAAVRQNLARVLAVSQGPREVLFRDVWDFVAELALGGDCQADPPTSPWFWRAFYGESEIARRLVTSIPPELIAMPGDDLRLYYGDWQNLKASPLQGVQLQWLPHKPSQAEDGLSRRNRMNWLRLQVGLTTSRADNGGRPPLVSPLESDAVTAVGHEKPDLLVLGLNRYHRFNLEAKTPEQVLELWIDLGIERRQHRPFGMFSLGTVPRTSIRVTRSEIVGNLPGTQAKGLRAYLRGPSGKGALRLDHRLLAALLRGRPIRLADRQLEDVDWAIWRFYIDLAASHEPRQLEVLRFSRDFANVSHMAWQIEAATHRIEPAI